MVEEHKDQQEDAVYEMQDPDRHGQGVPKIVAGHRALQDEQGDQDGQHIQDRCGRVSGQQQKARGADRKKRDEPGNERALAGLHARFDIRRLGQGSGDKAAGYVFVKQKIYR